MQIVELSDVYRLENVKIFIPAASSPTENGLTQVSKLVGHESLIFGSAWEEPVEIKRATMWRGFVLDKVEALSESDEHGGCTVDPVEF
jgi:hypothetical protein